MYKPFNTKCMSKKLIYSLFFSGLLLTANAQNAPSFEIESWVTQPDRSALFEKQTEKIPFTTQGRRGGATIVIDEQQTMQSVDGFGFALTGGSAELMMLMTPAARTALLQDLFSTKGNNAGVSYIRLTVGASDLNSYVFSYNDLKPGQTDVNLDKFDLA